MANCKEKNLLNEITYLTRLIGQHKKCQTSLSQKWEPITTILPKRLYQHSHKPPSHPYGSVLSQNREVLSYKYVSPGGKQNSLSWTRSSCGKKYSNVYINPQLNSGSPTKQLISSDPKSNTCSSVSKQLNVHINPHFNQGKSTKSVKVHINRNFNRLCDSKSKSEVSAIETVTSASIPGENLKVHMNPKFCKLLPDNSPHTQLRSLISNKVHVNPKLVEKVLKEKNESVNIHNDVHSCGNSTKKLDHVPAAEMTESCTFTEKHYFVEGGFTKSSVHRVENESFFPQSSLGKSEFLTLGKRKLVRVDHKLLKLRNEAKHKERCRTRRNSFSSVKHKSLAVNSASGLVKKAKAVTSKYKLVKYNFAVQSSNVKSSANKYKIDRRSPTKKPTQLHYNRAGEIYKHPSVLRSKRSCVVKTPLKQGKVISNVARSSNGNMVWRRTWNLQAKEFKTTNTKLYRIGSSPNLRRKTDSSNMNGTTTTFNRSLVRIGGVLYKSSRNKLTRSEGGVRVGSSRLNPAASLKKKGKGVSKRQILLIRGQKFVMDSKGKTLRRLSSSDPSIKNNQNLPSVYSFRRVDIGGVTFIKKSSNLLTRTNTHKARSLVSHAKQKSIATLMKKLKKNNQPCIFYQKFGKCLRMEKGTCPCVHDRKHVAVCKRFLQAKCNVDGCLLSHDVVPEKMPTCKYFLEGCCNRVNCPYLHVKVSSKADICTSFLQGYCSNGKKCKKRHVNICPDFEKKGKCIKGKHCPYPHKAVRPKKSQSKKRSVVQVPEGTALINKHTHKTTKAASQMSSKNELKRYYLAPQDSDGTLKSEEISSQKESKSLKELNSKLSIPCGSEVSNSCGSVPVVTSGDVKLSTFKRILQRDKIGALPSFIPLW